jgi:hypothetical protein
LSNDGYWPTDEDGLVWISILLAAATDPQGVVLPAVGAGGAGLSAVLSFLLWDERKERRADRLSAEVERRRLQDQYDDLLLRMLPVLTSVASGQERMIDALSRQVEYHERRPADPAVLQRAYDRLDELLAENPPPSTTRKRSRGTP